MGERSFNFRLTHCCSQEAKLAFFSVLIGRMRSYNNLFAKNRHPSGVPFTKPAERYYGGAHRSSEPQRQLPAALPVFLWPVLIKIHPTESAVALLLAVVGDLVVQIMSIILSIILVHAVLHRNHFCIPRTLLLWKASTLDNILLQEVC